MFKIGDKVFKGFYGRKERWVKCPDCFGSKRVKVVLGDDTEVSIECGGCYPGGFDPSLGIIRQYDYVTEAREHTVTGVNLRADVVSYELDNFGGSYYTATDQEVFATKDEAQAAAEEQRAHHEAEENRRLMAKTKDHKSWAWNATYHRRCAANAAKELAYHQEKARVCAAKSKEAA
jgi:hypothetical protein